MSRYLSIPNSYIWFWCYICYSRGILSDAWFVSVCYIVVLCRCSPLIFNALPSVLVCYPDFVFCPWIYEFEQRYTTVAFLYKKSIILFLGLKHWTRRKNRVKRFCSRCYLSLLHSTWKKTIALMPNNSKNAPFYRVIWLALPNCRPIVRHYKWLKCWISSFPALITELICMMCTK